MHWTDWMRMKETRPDPCAWCGNDRNYSHERDGTYMCWCPHETAVFVFGSNVIGVHGAGAAKHAMDAYGAEWGVGFGPTGRAYAIPSKDENIMTMPLEMIEPFVKEFLEYARANPGERFLVTRIGCGLAGYQDEQIAPMFFGAPGNCLMPIEWRNKWPEEFGSHGSSR